MVFSSDVLQVIAKRLNDNSWTILEILQSKESISMSHLMNLTQLKQHRLNCEISRLDGSVLININTNAADPRVKLVSLSPNGHAIMGFRPRE